jgi:hypothetical protein
VARNVTSWLRFRVDEVAGAIADAVRREILLMLRDQRLSAGQIAPTWLKLVRTLGDRGDGGAEVVG